MLQDEYVIVSGPEVEDGDENTDEKTREHADTFDVVWWSEPLFAPRTTRRITHIAVEILAE
jgi:hypothetical protein